MEQKKPNYQFYQNSTCEYFPCHSMKDTSNFNCKFCFCPLYLLEPECGGNYTYLEDGRKDCSSCLIPHQENVYDYVLEKLKRMKY